MAKRRPGYEDWSSPPDISGETPDTPGAHRVVVWLWIIGLIIFSLLVWGIGELTNLMQAGHGDPFFQWLGGVQK